MYLLANQWVKPVTRCKATGFASTFYTMLNRTEKQCGNQPEGGGKKKEDKQKETWIREKAVTGRIPLTALPVES
jgi:hypothetical protein